MPIGPSLKLLILIDRKRLEAVLRTDRDKFSQCGAYKIRTTQQGLVLCREIMESWWRQSDVGASMNAGMQDLMTPTLSPE